MSERPPQRTPNRRLASLISEAGFSNAGLARRVDQLGTEHGLDLRYDKTSVTRWLRGQQPRGTTPALIAEVFTRRLGRRLSAQDLGLDACAPVYAGLEFAATPAEAIDIVSGLWRKDSGSHAELRKIAFTPAGLVVPSRDWLIGRADEWVGRGTESAPPVPGGAAAAGGGARAAGGAHTVGDPRAAGGLGGSPGAAGATGAIEVGGAGQAGGPGGARGIGAQGLHGAHWPGGSTHGGTGAAAPAAAVGPGGPLPPGLPDRPHLPDPPHPRPLPPPREQDRRAPPVSPGSGSPSAAPASGSASGTSPPCTPSPNSSAPSTTPTGAATPGRPSSGIWSTRRNRCCAERTGGHRARLFSAAAELTRLAGWTSYDIAAHGLAQRYFVQALRLARAAGDRAYGAYVLITMSRQAVYLGHGREAVQLARVAQQGIGSSAPPVVQALLHAVEARGHGVLGEARPCTASLARAERALEAARPGDEVPHWVRYFDEAQLADELGHCHRDLQQYKAAAQHAERSLQLRAPAYARSRLFCRVVLATARLGLGELDQACLLGAEAAQQAAEMRSVRATEYVQDFERRLEPYGDAAAVRGYRERVAALG